MYCQFSSHLKIIKKAWPKVFKDIEMIIPIFYLQAELRRIRNKKILLKPFIIIKKYINSKSRLFLAGSYYGMENYYHSLKGRLLLNALSLKMFILLDKLNLMRFLLIISWRMCFFA